MHANSDNRTAFDIVADMEDDVRTARDFARAISLASSSLNVLNDDVFATLAEAIVNHCEAIEERRGQLFDMLHPRRDEFEQNGLPGDEAAEAA